MFCLSRGLGSIESNSSTKRHNDSTELEVKTATQPLRASKVSESIGKDNCGVGLGD